PRPTPVMQAFLRGVADHVEAEAARMLRALASEDPRVGETSLEATCDPISARVIRALLRDTISPNIVHAGVKYNVIPGEATVELVGVDALRWGLPVLYDVVRRYCS